MARQINREDPNLPAPTLGKDTVCAKAVILALERVFNDCNDKPTS
jgi:hypothetical protein